MTLGKTLREAREAYELNYTENGEYDPDWRIKCDEQVAAALRSKVIEEAIERLSQKKYEYEMNEETAPTADQESVAHWSGAVLALDEAIAMLERLKDQSNDPT